MQITGRQQGLTITPIWRLAFRPFFLFGMGFAALAVPLWVLALNGYLVDFAPASGWLNWHQHELIFGFAENPRASRYKGDYALFALLTEAFKHGVEPVVFGTVRAHRSHTGIKKGLASLLTLNNLVATPGFEPGTSAL